MNRCISFITYTSLVVDEIFKNDIITMIIYKLFFDYFKREFIDVFFKTLPLVKSIRITKYLDFKRKFEITFNIYFYTGLIPIRYILNPTNFMKVRTLFDQPQFLCM